MNHLLLGITVAGLPLLFIEGLSRRWQFMPEVSRKLTHVLSAVAVVGLTSFCSLQQIGLIGGLFFMILAALRPKHLWTALYRVKRRTWGELTFPLGIAVAALIGPDTRSFVCVTLIVGLSDSIASLVGQRFPKYKLPLFTTKTFAGSVAFLGLSLAILCLSFGHISTKLIGIALVATIAELIATDGFDNFSVALLTAAALRVVG